VEAVTDDDMRARILAGFDIREDDPDWVAFNTSTAAALEDAARKQARAEHDQYRDIVLPAMIERVEAHINATLPDGCTVRFIEEKWKP
jgi:hypothetical protein